MDPTEPPIWDLSQHLREGEAAITLIEANAQPAAQPLCHHFSVSEGVDPDRFLLEDGYADSVYRHVGELLAAQGIAFELIRLGAWETCLPTAEWLQDRIPTMFKIAADNRLIYHGWTWEPAKCQPIGACEFPVINNQT